MKEKIIKILIPVIAVLVIAESLVLLSKSLAPKTGPVQLPQSTKQPVTLKWDMATTSLKTGITSEVPLIITSDKDVSIDAVDLYIKYDPSMVTVSDAVTGKTFVTPSFKKVSQGKGMVVINYLVSDAAGFKLKAGQSIVLVRLKVNYIKQGSTQFSLGEGTLVVENATAKVLPFNNDKLVINVSR